MVIRPWLPAAHRLNSMHTDYGFQSAIVSLRTGNGLAAVMYYVTIVLDQTFHQLLISHEYRSVLMPYGETDSSRLVLESLEVLRAVGPVDLLLV